MVFIFLTLHEKQPEKVTLPFVNPGSFGTPCPSLYFDFLLWKSKGYN